MKRTTEYQANDGTRFATAEECKRHETEASLTRLEHMTMENVAAALDRTDVPLADAIERAGKLIGEKRRAMGGMRRKRKPVAEKHAEVPIMENIAEKRADDGEMKLDPITKMQPKRAKK